MGEIYTFFRSIIINRIKQKQRRKIPLNFNSYKQTRLLKQATEEKKKKRKERERRGERNRISKAEKDDAILRIWIWCLHGNTPLVENPTANFSIG